MTVSPTVPPADVEAFLAHYGVLGMQWGVHKKRDESGERTSGDSPWRSVKTKPASPEEQRRNLKEYEKKEAEKLEPSEGVKTPKQGLTPGQKKALYIAGGTVFVAGLAGTAYYIAKKNGAKVPQPSADFETFMAQRTAAKSATWAQGNVITKMSHDRPEITLKAGHVFTRISKTAEEGFGVATYTSTNADDANRYLGGMYSGLFKMGEDLHKINFTAKQDVKIPNLKTALDTLQETMSSGGKKVTPQEVLAKYNDLSGGRWDDGVAKSFFAGLKAKGFHAIVDEADAGIQSNLPIVIFAQEAVSSKTVTKLTSRDVDVARSLIKTVDELKS